MTDSKNVQHDLLLIITSLLFVFFATGLSTPIPNLQEPIIIP